MSATAFQRARREAAATMRASANSVQEEKEDDKVDRVEEHEEDVQESGESVEYTVAQLKEMCDEKGIEYKSRATRAELIELLGL